MVSIKRSREGMGQGNGRPVAAVRGLPAGIELRHMPEAVLGDIQVHKYPDQFDAGKRMQAFCFTDFFRLLRMSGSWATSVASYHQALAKGDEATHSPRSCETKGSHKILATVKHVSVILSYRRVSREGITRATQPPMGL